MQSVNDGHHRPVPGLVWSDDTAVENISQDRYFIFKKVQNLVPAHH